MTMYAEERQQAMAQLVAEHGRLSVNVARRAVRRHHRDRPPRPVRPGADGPGAPGARRRRARQLAGGDRVGPRRARRGQHRREGPDRQGRRSTCSRRPVGTVLLDAGTTTSRLASLLPRDHRLTVVTHAVPVAARLAGNPQVELHLLPGRVRSTTQAAVGAETVEALERPARRRRSFLGTNGLSRRARALHPRPRRGRDQAGDGRRRPPGRGLLADASKIGTESPMRFAAARRGRLAGHRLRHRRRADRRALERAGARGRGRVIVTLTANPSHDRTVTLTGPLARGACTAPSR